MVEIPASILEQFIAWQARCRRKFGKSQQSVADYKGLLKGIVTSSLERLDSKEAAALYGPLASGCEIISHRRFGIDIVCRRGFVQGEYRVHVEAIFEKLRNPLFFPNPPAIEADKVVISRHAEERFEQRYGNDIVKVVAGVGTEKLLRCFLSMSCTEELNERVRFKRLLRNKESARYFRLQNYRFVVVDDVDKATGAPVQCLRTFEHMFLTSRHKTSDS
jgi:hypothetical protein